MLRAIVLTAFASLILGFAPPSKPRPAADPRTEDCSDDRGVDRCQPEQQRRVRELFGVEPIESHRDAGDQVRRAFYVSGYGREVVAIVFIRPKGGDPMLRVHFPRADDGSRNEPLHAAVPHTVWEDVIRRSSHFDEQLKRLPKAQSSSGEITLCMHSWVFTVEATDPAGEYRPGKLRSRTEDACDDGLVEAYAGELERAAVPLLPPCAKLDRTQYRNEASLLSACRLLRGDRLAAAGVMNLLERFDSIEKPEDATRLQGLFDDQAQIDWAGEKFAAAGGAAEAWARKMSEGGLTHLDWDYIQGETSDRVRFVGMLSRSIENETGYRQARVELIWRRAGDSFEIQRATVGAFEPQPAESRKP